MTTLMRAQEVSGQSPDRRGHTVVTAVLIGALVFGIIGCVVVGTILTLAGVPLQKIFVLLCGCGVIGVTVFGIGVTVVIGSRRRCRRLRTALAALTAIDSAPEQ